MPRTALRSNALRKIRRKVPGGASIIHYFKKRVSRSRCSACGDILPGTISARKIAMKKNPKSKRRPKRAHGGNLCSKCSRKKIKRKARR